MAIKGRAQKTLTKIFDGSGVFSIIITNENTSIPISNQGLALNYSATPTDAYVYSGTSILTPVKSNPEAGQYTISVDGENITPGIVSMNGNHASIGNASNMVSNKDSYSINITASGKDFLGNPFTSQKKQVITPLKRGDDATSYWLNVTSSVITKDVKNNMTPSDVTVSSVAQSGFSDPREYSAIFKVYYKTGIDFSSTPSYTSKSPEKSYKITPDSNVNDIKIEMYDEGSANLLDVQTIPIISQANGVISTKIVYTVTNTAVQPNDSANWSNTMPTVGKGQYLWTKTTFYYTDGSNAVAYSLGSVGKDGSSAALLTLVSDSQVFTFKSDNVTPSPASQVINFVANLQNVTGTATFVATPYLGSAAGTPIVLGGTGNARTLTVDQFGKSYDSVVVKATLGSLSDTETIHKLKDGYDGTDGKNGTNGVQGPKGSDGKSSYVHIAYSNSADGSKDFSTSVFSGKAFIGIYTDETESDSTDYKNYTWSLVKGTDGKSGSDGAQGPKGSDGKTSYVHVAYANSADGNTGFSTTDPSGKAYIGVLTDFVEQDSTDPKKYTWSLAKGSDGEDGSDGLPGPKGADGISTYVHFAYANSADGSKDFSTTAYAGKLYIGTLTDTTVADSKDYKKYTWSLIKGADGKDGSDGLPGPKGTDGVSTYVHFAYANSADGSKDFSTTDYSGRSYIGNLTDTTQADSTDYKKYTWSLVKGADGKDSLSGWLTNEAITVQADSNGNVPNFSTAKGTFVVYNGTSPVTGLTITQSNATGMTVSISGMDYSVTAMTQDSGYVDLIAKTAGVTITKRLTVAKSKAGATGENGTSVVNSTTPPKNPDEGQWWNDLSVTPNILKVYQKGQWVPYRIDAINLVANSITTDQLASSVLKANNIIYTNSNGTTTNLQTFDFDGIKTLLTDTNGNTYSNMESAVGSTKVVSSLQNKTNTLGQVNLINNSDFRPDLGGWTNNGLGNFTTGDYDYAGGVYVVESTTSGLARTSSSPIPINGTAQLSYSLAFNSYIFNLPSGGRVTAQITYLDSSMKEISAGWSGFIELTNKGTGKWVSNKQDNIIFTPKTGTAYIVFSFDSRGSGTKAGFNRPILVKSSSVGDYVPGQYNNNERILKIEETADKYQISIGRAQDTADTANGKIDNISVGTRNYVLNSSGINATDTSRPTLMGTSSSNTRSTITYDSSGVTMTNSSGNTSSEWYYQVAKSWTNFSSTPLIPGNSYVFSADVMGTAKQAVLRYGFNGVGGKDAFKSFSINNSDWTRVSLLVTSSSTNTGLFFRIQGGVNNQYSIGFSGGETVKFRNVKIEDGNVPTAWAPAPEDDMTNIASLQSQSDNMALNNLFPNSDFDSNYGYSSKGTKTTLSLGTKSNIDGAYNGTVSVTSTGTAYEGYWANNIQVQGGQKYSASVKVHYTNNGLSAGKALLDLWFVDKDLKRISSASVYTSQVSSPYWVKLTSENFSAPINAKYLQMNLIVNNAGAGQVATFTQPVLVSSSKVNNYTPNDNIKTTLKLTADNYSMGIDANGNLISGISGNAQQVTLKGNVIHLDGNTNVTGDFYAKGGNFTNLNIANVSGSNPSLIKSNFDDAYGNVSISPTNITLQSYSSSTLVTQLDIGNMGISIKMPGVSSFLDSTLINAAGMSFQHGGGSYATVGVMDAGFSTEHGTSGQPMSIRIGDGGTPNGGYNSANDMAFAISAAQDNGTSPQLLWAGSRMGKISTQYRTWENPRGFIVTDNIKFSTWDNTASIVEVDDTVNYYNYAPVQVHAGRFPEGVRSMRWFGKDTSTGAKWFGLMNGQATAGFGVDNTEDVLFFVKNKVYSLYTMLGKLNMR